MNRWTSSQPCFEVRGQELLQALEGLSPWDAKKIQELLRLRQDYFLDMKWDPERSRFSCHLVEQDADLDIPWTEDLKPAAGGIGPRI